MDNKMDNKLGYLLSEQIEGKKTKCLSDNSISQLIDNTLSSIQRMEVFKHLNSCENCFEIYKISSEFVTSKEKKINKTVSIPLSLAASILFVFLLGYYYSTYYKSDSTAPKISPKMDSIVKPAGKKKESRLDETLSFKVNEVEGEKEDKKKHLPTTRQIFTYSKDKRKRSGEYAKPMPHREKQLDKVNESVGDEKLKSDLNVSVAAVNKISGKKEKFNRSLKESDGDTEVSEEGLVSQPRKSRSVKMTKNVGASLKKENGSIFSGLIKKGYVYKNKNHFEKLDRKNILDLLAKWKTILPTLKSVQKTIALETIKYLEKMRAY